VNDDHPVTRSWVRGNQLLPVASRQTPVRGKLTIRKCRLRQARFVAPPPAQTARYRNRTWELPIASTDGWRTPD